MDRLLSSRFFLSVLFCGNKGFEALRTGPSGQRDYQSSTSMSPFLMSSCFRSGTGRSRLRKVRQLPMGQKVTHIFISSVCACELCRGASLCGDCACQGHLGVTQPSSCSHPPRAPTLPPLRQVPTWEGGRSQKSRQSNVSGASAASPQPPPLGGWSLGPHSSKTKIRPARPMPSSPGVRVPIYCGWPAAGEIETPDQQAGLVHPWLVALARDRQTFVRHGVFVGRYSVDRKLSERVYSTSDKRGWPPLTADSLILGERT